MSKAIPSLAARLLVLEKIQKTRPLDSAEVTQWEELVFQVFGEESEGSVHRKNRITRKSYRIPCQTKCTIKFGAKMHEGQLFEVSLCGFAFKCKSLMGNDSDFLFIFNSVQVQDKEIHLQVECKTVNFVPARNDQKFGAKIDPGNSADTLTAYVDNVYYPLYMAFLETLVTKKS